MVIQPKERHIAYRCPECTSAVLGLVGKFALHADLLRLKCSCHKPTALDIGITSDGKIRLSVPCLFCKQSHTYYLNEGVFFGSDKFLLNCPYTGMDIAFIGTEAEIGEELARTETEIGQLLASLEAEDISDIQPRIPSEDEVLPDPAVYDTIRFIVKDLEEEGAVECPCGEGPYDIRFCDEGMQVYCERCGATYTFYARTPSLSEEYLSLDRIKLK